MVASIDLKILLRLRPCLMRGHWLLRIIHVLPYTLTHRTHMDTYCAASACCFHVTRVYPWYDRCMCVLYVHAPARVRPWYNLCILLMHLHMLA